MKIKKFKESFVYSWLKPSKLWFLFHKIRCMCSNYIFQVKKMQKIALKTKQC